MVSPIKIRKAHMASRRRITINLYPTPRHLPMHKIRARNTLTRRIRYGETAPNGQSPYGNSAPSPYDPGTINGQPPGQYQGYPSATQPSTYADEPAVFGSVECRRCPGSHGSKFNERDRPDGAGRCLDELARAQCSEFRNNGPLAPNLRTGVSNIHYGVQCSAAVARTSQLDIDVTVLLSFLEDHEVTLDGAVRGPGTYVIGPGIKSSRPRYGCRWNRALGGPKWASN